MLPSRGGGMLPYMAKKKSGFVVVEMEILVLRVL